MGASFVIGLVIGLGIGGMVAHVLARMRFEEQRLRLEFLHHFEMEIEKLRLDSVIVKPIEEWRGQDFVAPLREPIAAVIDGQEYKEGENVTEHLIIQGMMDEGMGPYSPSVLLVPTEPDVRIDEHVFHNAALIDEWAVHIGFSPNHPRYKEWHLKDVSFRLETSIAKYEDGSNASLASHSASYVDGTPISLPRERSTFEPDSDIDLFAGSQ